MDWNRRDFFLLWRSIWESPDFRSLPTGDSRMVMIAILSEANWAERTFACNRCGRTFTLQPGDAWVNLSQLARMAATTRDVARAAVKRLSRSCFVSRQNECHHHMILRLTNRAKFIPLDDASHTRATAEPHPSHTRATAEPHHKRIRKDGNTERRTTTAPELDLPEPKTDSHLADATKTADAIRTHIIDNGLDAPGYRTERGYLRRRLGWAKTLKAGEEDLGLTQEQMRDDLRWAVAESQSWERDGEVWTWLDVLACSEPAKKFIEKLPKIRARRAKESKKRKRQAEDEVIRMPHANISPSSMYDKDGNYLSARERLDDDIPR